MKRALSLACLFLVSVTAHAQNRGTASSNSCDRECLRGFIAQYLEAMIAHNPKTLPTAATARFTENTKTLPLGEGLWKGASVRAALAFPRLPTRSWSPREQPRASREPLRCPGR